MTIKHTDADAAVFRRAARGDIEARNDMAERHFGLVQNLATYYAKRNPHLDMDDLLQEGRIGVVVALGKFNVDKGYRFSTYATYWIKHYIQRYVMDNHSRGASTTKKDTETYLMRQMDDGSARMYEARCIRHMSMSADTVGGTSFDEIVEDRDAVPIEESSMVRMEWNRVERMLFHETIDPNQRTVVCMRFGVMGFRPHTVGEVADKLGMPPLRVTAIEQTTVTHISTLMEEIDGDDGDQALDCGQATGQAEGEGGTARALHASEDEAGGGGHCSGVEAGGGTEIPFAQSKGSASDQNRHAVSRRAAG